MYRIIYFKGAFCVKSRRETLGFPGNKARASNITFEFVLSGKKEKSCFFFHEQGRSFLDIVPPCCSDEERANNEADAKTLSFTK